MSHRAFAALWLQLEMRTDIDSIVCELIGRHNLEPCSPAANADQLQRASCGLAIFLRVVFDLQRTYLQCPKPGVHAAHFLRPSKLLSAVIYLFRVKTTVFASAVGDSEQYETKRSFVTQALVSGLRALWLWRHPFSKDKMDPLRTLHGAWDESSDLDIFLKRICSHMIREIADLKGPPSNLSFPACRVVNLQDYSTGLNPLETRDNDLIKSVEKASLCLRLDKQEWFKNYWIVFDIAWTTEAALIQLYMHPSKSSNSDTAALQNKNINHLYATRKAVLDIISTSKTVESVIRSSLHVILFASCWGRTCDCLEHLKAPLSNSNDPSAKFGSMQFDKIGKPSDEITGFVTEMLDHYQKVLGIRKENLRDCNGDLAELSENLDCYLDDWYSDKVKVSTACSDRRNAYIISCPELHQIPYQMLKNLIEGSSGKIGLEELEKKSTLFDVDITCDQCDSEHPVTKARQIDPLGKFSAMMYQKLDQKPLLESGVQLPPDVRDPQRSSGTYDSNSTPSMNRSLSNRVSSSDMGSPIFGDLNLFFDEPPKKSYKLAQPSYTFSSNGQSLLLWKKFALHLTLYDITSEEVEKFDATNVVLAAAGANVYAVISRQGNGQKLSIHRRVGRPEVGKKERIPLVYSIAVSSNDKFVAVGFHNEILIYVVETQEILNHKLVAAAGKDIESQLISFSANCEELIIATRYEDGNVYTSVRKCLKPRDDPQLLPRCRIDTNRHNDFGLSSVLYHSNFTHACITAFTYSKPPVLLPTPESGGSAWPIPEIGTQIQCAAVSPLGGKFMLVNNLNHVYRVEQSVDGANGAWITEKLKVKVDRKMVSSRSGLMAMAVPDEETARLFWIEDSRWTLMTIPW